MTHNANDVEEYFDSLKFRLRERLGGRDPIMILPYNGYGSPDLLYLKGRVLEDKGIQSARDNDTIWDNLVNMYKRFESDEIPYAQVQATFQTFQEKYTCDEEGFFEVHIEPEEPLNRDQPWHEIGLELLKPLRKGYAPVSAQGKVLVPPQTARFGVISDMDDTFVRTDATHMIHMARIVFLGNARTRLPFKGVASFYKALNEGGQGNEQNPLFFVSSSPWNLYDLFSDFLKLQGIPQDPVLFLNDWGFSEQGFAANKHRQHKEAVCRRLLNLYKDLPFILIGDSGQQDPEIYNEIVRLNPERILAVYIRNVSRGLKRPEAVRELAKKVIEAGSTLILADNTLPMAQHAIEQGWISPAAFPEIHAEKKAEEEAPTPVEEALGIQVESPKKESPTVVIAGKEPERTQSAVAGGAIETALDKAGKDEKEETTAPTVVVKGN
ncbi:MAG: App1 family protein [Omnitrophica WOR_2 bacterium]